MDNKKLQISNYKKIDEELLFLKLQNEQKLKLGFPLLFTNASSAQQTLFRTCRSCRAIWSNEKSLQICCQIVGPF